MQQVVARMFNIAKTLQGFDIDARLQNPHKGWRLFAYVYCIANPDFSRFDTLAQSAYENTGLEENKNQPFGEYWSIRAMQALAAKRGTQEVSNRAKKVLLDWYQRIRRETDRHFEMKRLLQMLEIPVPA